MLLLVDPDRREITLADGTVKKIPVQVAEMAENAQHEAVDRFVRGNNWMKDGDEVAILPS